MELFKILGTVAIDNQNATQALEDTTETAEQSHGKISAAFEKIGSAAVAVGKVMATGLAAGAAAFTGLVKQAIGDYAEYEQLIGGVETLYGASIESAEEYAKKHGISLEEASATWEQYQGRQKTVLNNAANAYKTAGMSANEYMNTVNGFAASLTSSLGEYEWQAANYADMIVTDMADNANKMGTSLESIQNAYSGFAKQNYTMLDNLKLGYGGTKEEMERLLRDAEEFAGYLEGSLSIDSFADVAEAINIIQTKLGITGTTAKEASSTIQGSVATMKSAWTNFVAGMADDTQDFDTLLGNLVDSIVTVANNLVPRLQMLLPRLVEGLNQLINTLLPYIPEIVETLLPGIIEGATALLTGLIVALPQILQILLEQIPFILTQIGGALTEAFPVLLETVKSLFGQIWDYIAVELLGTSADFESTFARVEEIFDDVWAALLYTWETVGQPIWDMVQSAVEIIKNAFAERMPEIREFVSNCFTDISAFWNNNLKPCFDAIGDFIRNVLAPIFKEVFENNIKGTIDTVFNAIKSLWNDTLKPIFTGITDFLTGVFTLNWEQAWNGIVSILKGIVNGVITGIEFMINGAINSINAVISGINKLAGLAGDLLGLSISIPLIPTVELPKLEEGGVLEAGQVGLLEGNGAEAVVPLERNKKWISAVAKDMDSVGMGGSDEIRELKEAFKEFVEVLPEMMVDAFATMKFEVNNREFARLVKAVN